MSASAIYEYLGDGVGIKRFPTVRLCQYSFYRQSLAHHYGLAPRCFDLKENEFKTEHLPFIISEMVEAQFTYDEAIALATDLKEQLAAVGIADCDLLSLTNSGFRKDMGKLLAIDLGNGYYFPTFDDAMIAEMKYKKATGQIDGLAFL